MLLGSAKVVIVFVVCALLARTQSSVPSDDQIRAILAQRIDEFHQSVGIVVGIIEASGRRIVSYGALDKGDSRPLIADTVFEIGSITKVFTSLLLSDMVQRAEVALTDPVAKYLPASVRMPQRKDRQITLEDLATHTSGLPRLPTNFKPTDPANPYADYTVAQLYEFLSSYELTRDIGSQYEYSNFGGGLLGHVLALHAGIDYEALVRSRITEPLQMHDTAITLSPEMKARFAVGHNRTLKPVPTWDSGTLAGMYALRSTTNDLLTFLGANLGYTKTPLASAMAAMLDVRRPTGTPGLEVALAWHILTRKGDPLIRHNGGTGGYRSFIACDPKARVGVVVLSNASTIMGVDDIGTHLLDPTVPLLPAAAFQPAKQRTEITVDPKIFDRYTGRYELAPNFILTITREDDHLFVQATGQSKFEMFAESDKEYFLKIIDAQITFETDSSGRATALVLHQLGRDQRATRIE